ncbi:hypothetical protein SAMN04488056_106147 [Cohaesibacter marisflavi]|uniref:Uncharacterized protein n=1 Tax=Cohaesibacter marisflavi TaxID=655353 RepID=A0A1I5HBU3_9HYPH|nr:hypothetical protein [Cohaesibacter marisflavi]SFO45703.1 hypothetical protein SAMN04488056_106147 [Cohaesibacter marisflavi]
MGAASKRTGNITQPQIERAIKAAKGQGLGISEMHIEPKQVRLVFGNGEIQNVASKDTPSNPQLKGWD